VVITKAAMDRFISPPKGCFELTPRNIPANRHYARHCQRRLVDKMVNMPADISPCGEFA
jgi:hypothetical protein